MQYASNNWLVTRVPCRDRVSQNGLLVLKMELGSHELEQKIGEGAVLPELTQKWIVCMFLP